MEDEMSAPSSLGQPRAEILAMGEALGMPDGGVRAGKLAPSAGEAAAAAAIQARIRGAKARKSVRGNAQTEEMSTTKRMYNYAKDVTGYNYAKKSAWSTLQHTMEARMIGLWTSSLKFTLASDPRTPWFLRTIIHQLGDMVWLNVVEEIVRSVRACTGLPKNPQPSCAHALLCVRGCALDESLGSSTRPSSPSAATRRAPPRGTRPSLRKACPRRRPRRRRPSTQTISRAAPGFLRPRGCRRPPP